MEDPLRAIYFEQVQIGCCGRGQHAEGAMGARQSHAYNYWRKVFVDKAGGAFSEEEFDRWFWRTKKKKLRHVVPFIAQEKPGSKAHFRAVVHESMVLMLVACARGDFSK